MYGCNLQPRTEALEFSRFLETSHNPAGREKRICSVDIAMDYIYGDAKIYVNKALFNEKEFEAAFKEAYQGILCWKSVGNKGKSKDSPDNKLTPADLLKSVGLSGEGKGSYLRGGYLSIKATSPFLFTVRPIEAEQFYAKYQEHLSRLADHILHPTLML